jgi:hypothetical protein
MYMCVYMYVCMYVFMYSMCLSMYVSIRICMCVYICWNFYVYVCVYIYLCIFYLQHAPLQIVILHAWNDLHSHCVYLSLVVLTCYVVIDILVYVWFYMF